MIAIIDYGLGNLRSIRNMLSRIGVESLITSEAAELATADRVILPGVGSFDAGMKGLHQSGMLSTLEERVIGEKVPILGICLGAQLLTQRSEEGEMEGLGWVEAETVRFDEDRLPASLAIPHMGWGDVFFERRDSIVSDYRTPDPRFYFVHSYHIQTFTRSIVLATATHGVEFTAAVCKENIVGAQFHPEKSHRFGMEFLRCFSEFNGAESPKH